MTGRTDDPIGVFDSGIGGLTVVREILRALPHERLVYLGDTARLPYGSKSATTVRAYTLQNLRFLRSHHVKAIVVACNTASALALHAARRRLRLPVLGVIDPGATEAVSRSASGRIGVLGTRATIGSGAYDAAIRRRRPTARVLTAACPLFVPLAEEGMHEGAVAETVARLYLRPLLARRVDTLVLGCTHYPLLSATLAAVAGPRVTLVDSATAVASALRRLLQRRGLARTEGRGTLAIYLTDQNPQFARIGARFLGRSLGRVRHVDL